MRLSKWKSVQKVSAVLILALIMFFCFIGEIFGERKAEAFSNATKVTSQSTNLGEMLLEGYADNPGGNVFDGEVFWELIKEVSGVENPTISTLNSLGTKTSADFRTQNDGKDVVVTINGKPWTATYLSQTSNGPILTLWLATSTIQAKWNDQATNTNGNYPNNMYGTSYMRASVLNNGGSYAPTYNANPLTLVSQSAGSAWAIYTMDDVNGSLTSFIEVPNNVSWQLNQSAKESAGRPYNYNNDALNSGGTYDTAHNYLSKTNYKDWGNDRLWLPSIAETGISGESGIWQASVNQRANSDYSWTRTANSSQFRLSYRLAAEGTAISDGTVTVKNAVRPAFHLNLKLASEKAGSLGLDEPTDVEVEYTGQQLSLANVTDISKISWYDSTKMDLSYPAGMTDAGTYQVTATIKSALADDGLIFKGDPDTSKGESDTIRKFNFTINKKKIGVNVGLDTGGMPVVALKSASDVYSGDTTANGRSPNLGFNYTSINGYNSDTLPTAVGEYTATAKILNDCNYELDNTYSTTFKITKIDVPIPTISGQATKQYTGEDITFTITGGTNADISIALPDGMTKNGNTLTVKKAGKYKVVATLTDNGVSTQWNDGSTGAKELEFEVSKKPLGIVITCSVADFTWNFGETPTVTIVGDSYPSDSTELYIYYIDNTNPTIKHDDINNNKVIDGKTRTIIMPSDIPQGSYTICVELYGDSKDNSNYSLTVPKTAMFTVKGNKVTVDGNNIVWKINENAINDRDEFTYTGNTYQISVDESVLASHGAKIDISKGINGYSGDITVTNAKSGYYSVTVYITNLDSSYESHSSQYTLTYKINKAIYDLSALSWPTTNSVEYNGTAQSMILQGTIPQGLTVSYSGNGNIPVGNYTTTATFKVGDNYSDNYYVPTAGASDTYTGNLDFTFSWSITKAMLSASWKDDNNGSSEVYKLPTLKSMGALDLNSMVDYTYYDSEGNIVTSLPTNTTEEMTFKAVATLKSAYAGNYEFVGTSNEYTFTIGSNKYPVILTLIWDGKNIDNAQLPYTGVAYAPTVEILKTDSGKIQANHITLTYYKDGSTSGSTQAPIGVGHYRVEATLNYGGDLNYIDSDSAEFEFEIIKADFDVSGLIWQYTHGEVTATYDFTQGKWLDDNGEEILPMTYDKTAHTLTLLGKDSIKDLTVTISGNEGTNANSYTAQVTFVYDTTNYNAPNFSTSLAWSIAKAKIDVSGIVWGYVKGVSSEEFVYTEALPYTRIDGGEVQYTVSLINVPEVLKEYIVYSGTGKGAKSEIGTYVTEYRIEGLDANNYEAIVMPSGLNSKLNWTITPKMIDKPVFDNTWTTFDGEVHDFLQMFGIQEPNWKQYMTVTIKKDGEAYTGLSGEAYDYLTDKEYKGIKAGEYTVKFDLIINNENAPNVKWTDWPDYEYNIRVRAYEVDVDEWQGSNTNAEVPMEDWLKQFTAYRYIDSEGNPVTLSGMQPNVVYYKELYAIDGYEDDIEIYGNYKFSVVRPGAVVKLQKPVFDESKVVTYDGNVHSPEEFLKKAMDSGVKLTADREMKDAGEYVITISLDNEMFTWEDGSQDSYTYTVTIEKRKIPQSALKWEMKEGVPTLNALGYSGLEFTYEYYDEGGNLLTIEQIQAGVPYDKVFAKLEDDNYVMLDASNEVVDKVEYLPNQGGNNSGGNGVVDFGKVGEILKEWWQVIASVISIILIVIFTAKGIGYASKRKQTKKTTENKYRNYYAGATTGLFGLAMTAWNVIAGVLMGLAVLSLVFMLIEKRSYKKAVVEMEDARDEYERNKADVEERKRDENMRMMLMGMMGSNANSGVQQPAVDMGEIRGMIEETMARQLPPVASNNDETIQRLNDTIANLQ